MSIGPFQAIHAATERRERYRQTRDELETIAPEIRAIINKNREAVANERRLRRKMKEKPHPPIRFLKPGEAKVFLPSKEQIDHVYKTYLRPPPPPTTGKDKQQNEHPAFLQLKTKYALEAKRIHHIALDHVNKHHISQLISRQDAIDLVKSLPEKERLCIGITQINEIDGELWLRGHTRFFATVAIRIEHFEPFFFLGIPKEELKDGMTADLIASRVYAILNDETHWPSSWIREKDRSRKRNAFGSRKQRFTGQGADRTRELFGGADGNDGDTLRFEHGPVLSVNVEHRVPGTQYQGRDPLPYLRINFADTDAFRHYQTEFALGRFNVELGFESRIFHEENTFTQMLFNVQKYQFFGYVSIAKEHCNFLEATEWDEVYVAYRRADDEHLAELQRRNDALASTILGMSDEGDNAGARFQNKAKEREHLSGLQKPKCQTKALLEMCCSIEHIRAEPKLKMPLEFLLCIFDIETGTGSSIRQQQTHPRVLPLHEPDWKDEDYYPPPLTTRTEIPYTTTTEKTIFTDDESKAETTARARVHPKDRFDDEEDEAEQHEMKIERAEREALQRECAKNEGDRKTGERQNQKTTPQASGELMVFPFAANPNDPVLYISTHWMIYGHPGPFIKVLHCLGQPQFLKTDLEQMVVYTFDDEKTMLEHWTSMLAHMNTEWVCGYNSIGYDLPYVFTRARVLKSDAMVDDLSGFLRQPWDRIMKPRRFQMTQARERFTPQQKRKSQNMPLVETPGLIQFDAYKTVKQMAPNLDEYKLKFVAEKYELKVSKKDMPYELISPFWAAGPKHQREVAMYCDMDVVVTEQVMVKASFISHAIAVAQLTFTSVAQQMMQGQQIKTYNLMVHRAHHEDWILDEEKRQEIQRIYDIASDCIRKYLRRFWDVKKFDSRREDLIFRPEEEEETTARRREKKYAGATVLDPTPGLYHCRVTTADFSSLYPSLMIAFNLCFSTFVPHALGPETKDETVMDRIYFPFFDTSFETRNEKNQYVLWDPETDRPSDEVVGERVLIMVCHDFESGVVCCFVVNRKAFLPSILKDMLALRKVVKKQMEEAETKGDKAQEKILDAQQAAIKVICNAAYGFTGAMKGYFGCIPIAITTCFLGRLKILFTKNSFEQRFGGRIIYGDTDSVFSVWDGLEALVSQGKTQEEVHALVMVVSFLACEWVSQQLPKPMGLAFEKLMTPFLLIGKKQYVGQFVYPTKKLLTKGIAAVRRDSCPLARRTIRETMKEALNPQANIKSLLAPCQRALELLQCKERIPEMLDELKRTVAKKNEYKNEDIMQCRLFRKLEARRKAQIDEGTRVPYIMILPGEGKNIRVRGKKDGYKESAEDVEFLRKNLQRFQPDRCYYVEKQLRVPLERYLAAIPGAVDKLTRMCREASSQIEAQVHGIKPISFKRKVEPFLATIPHRAEEEEEEKETRKLGEPAGTEKTTTIPTETKITTERESGTFKRQRLSSEKQSISESQTLLELNHLQAARASRPKSIQMNFLDSMYGRKKVPPKSS